MGCHVGDERVLFTIQTEKRQDVFLVSYCKMTVSGFFRHIDLFMYKWIERVLAVYSCGDGYPKHDV